MDEIRTDKLNRIILDDTFSSAVGHYLQEKEKGVSPVNFLTDKKFTIKDTDSTYRVINHWSSLGLFDDARPDDNKGWRKFSLVDMTWLRVLMELRAFGVALEKIKIGYQAIKEKAEIFEYGVALCMMRKGINLIVFSDGYMEVIPRGAITMSESIGYFKETAYLVISLNSCLERIIPNRDYSPKLDAFELSKKEISVLSVIRSGAYDEIVIQMKNGDLERIDTKIKHVGEIGKLAEILNKVSHGEFQIKKQDGKIVFVEAVKKEKL